MIFRDSDRQAQANSVDPDQMPQNEVSYQGLYCWPLLQQFLDISTGSKMDVLLYLKLKYVDVYIYMYMTA